MLLEEFRDYPADPEDYEKRPMNMMAARI
jgi:hypothetical protein